MYNKSVIIFHFKENSMNKLTKRSSLAIVLIVYLAAFALCFFLFNVVNQWTGSFILTFFILDILATLFVWAAGLVFSNASVYDPYWSVAPPVMAIFFTAYAAGMSTAAWFFIGVLAVWGARLTANWIVDWNGISQQDWRYTMLHDKNPGIYFLTNLFGINLVPTLFVFAAMIPAFVGISMPANINVLSVIGILICISAATLQLISDGQMRAFRHSGNKGKHMQSGLWKYSRHPNYFGEVSFWWGIYIIQLSIAPNYWYTIAGPVLMTLLFVFISVPMMKNKLLSSKEGYADYVRTTSMLIPLPRKK